MQYAHPIPCCRAASPGCSTVRRDFKLDVTSTWPLSSVLPPPGFQNRSNQQHLGLPSTTNFLQHSHILKLAYHKNHCKVRITNHLTSRRQEAANLMAPAPLEQLADLAKRQV